MDAGERPKARPAGGICRVVQGDANQSGRLDQRVGSVLRLCNNPDAWSSRLIVDVGRRDRGQATRKPVMAVKTSMLDYAFFEGRIVPFEDARISIGTHAIQYGTGAFAGIRGYLDQDGETIN